MSNKKLELKAKFLNGDFMPIENSCEGGNISPELSWQGIPNAASYVLIVDDPDAPRQFLKPDEDAFVHWLVCNIPPAITHLRAGVSSDELAHDYILVGSNSSGKQQYMGPCPPSGEPHRYYFKLFALDRMLAIASGATKNEIISAMQGHIIDQTLIMGKYRRHYGEKDKA